MGELGAAENVWLAALGIACVAPLLALVVPRLSRVFALIAAVGAFALALFATAQQQTMLALALITLAATAGLLVSWSTRTVRESVGPLGRGPSVRHRCGRVTLTPAQSRSLDYLLMR
jgi:predicted MFS family arabinose efflux permease